MANAKTELTRAWLRKANRDLGSAKKLAEDSEPYFDTAIYHCQQTAEKAIKAYLVFHDIEFEKVHNLSVLIESCTEIDSDFQTYADAADTLTPYATAFRYPNELFEDEPDTEQMDEAVELAEQILDFVLQKLPKNVHP
ncbi:MAG: HEPN domain-containing protein [bacterium]